MTRLVALKIYQLNTDCRDGKLQNEHDLFSQWGCFGVHANLTKLVRTYLFLAFADKPSHSWQDRRVNY